MKSEIKKKIKNQPPAQAKVQGMSVTDPKKENKFILITLVAYVIVGLIGVFHHEMWRDELQTWLVAAASNTLGDFLHNMRTECNPLMWYSINFILSRFTDSPLIAQIFHLLISTGSVFLILKYAPFSRLQKVLLSFSYYLLFEYSLIARGYALTVFFTFLFCTLYQAKSKNRYLILSFVLFLLPNTTGLHGIILTISLMGMMLTDYFFSEDTSIRKKYTPTQLFIALAIALAGIYIALKCISPADTSERADAWFIGIDMHRMTFVSRTFWMSYLPIPDFSSIHFWNYNFFFQANTSNFTFTVLFLIALSIFSYNILLYSKKTSIAVLYLTATCGILLACYTNGVILSLMATRHYGFMFIAFIAAAWLAPQVKKTRFVIAGLNSLRNKLKVEKNFTYLLTALLAINALGGVIAYAKDYSLPFSNIKKTSDYIIDHHLTHLPETGYIDYSVSPTSAYTKQFIYFPDRDTTGRFTTWGISRFSFDPKVVLARITRFISQQKDSVLFITTADYLGIGNEKVINNIHFTSIASFYDCVIPDENYYLYIAEKIDINELMQDSSSFKNLGKVNSIVSAAYDLYKNNKINEAEKILLTVEEKTHGMAVPHLHNYLGMVYTKENKPTEAVKEFQTELSMGLQKEEAFFYMGMLYYQNKNYDSAITAWDSTLKIDSKNGDALNNLGVCYLNYKKDYGKAKIYFEKAVEIEPDYTDAYYCLLACAQNTNDEETLIKYTRILLDKGISLNDIKAKGITIPDELLQKINAR